MVDNNDRDTTSKVAENLAQRILNALPATWQTATTEMNTIIKSTLQDALLKMDLLTRDEFDAQKNVLNRLIKKVTELEIQIQQLEEQNKEK